VIQQLSPSVRLVRAPNPGPMTLDGTNTYVVGAGDDLLIIDPGPSDETHLAAVRGAVGDARVTAILLTHRHHDHAEAARTFADAFDAQVCGFGGPDDVVEVPVADGARVGGHGVFLKAVHTPGHAADHVCYVLEEDNVVFSGDHVLGRGTTVIVWPDGDMRAYLRGLDVIAELQPRRIFPGHGPILDDPMPVIAFYKQHRLQREEQVFNALPGTPSELVERVYADVDPAMHRAAELSLRAHLAKLHADGRAFEDDGVWRAS
jgi:glyoxylase-like metal-dependent hydrolase (beta-lactamase superfamily II)